MFWKQMKKVVFRQLSCDVQQQIGGRKSGLHFSMPYKAEKNKNNNDIFCGISLNQFLTNRNMFLVLGL